MLTNTRKIARLMGARTVIEECVPLWPQHCFDMGYFMEDIDTALSLEEDLQLHSDRAPFRRQSKLVVTALSALGS